MVVFTTKCGFVQKKYASATLFTIKKSCACIHVSWEEFIQGITTWLAECHHFGSTLDAIFTDCIVFKYHTKRSSIIIHLITVPYNYILLLWLILYFILIDYLFFYIFFIFFFFFYATLTIFSTNIQSVHLFIIYLECIYLQQYLINSTNCEKRLSFP